MPPPFWRGWRGRRGCWLARLLQGIGGAATATLGFTSLIYAASEGPKNGWASLATLGTAGLGAVLLGLFVAAERRASAPLVPLPILCRRAVAVPNAAVVLKLLSAWHFAFYPSLTPGLLTFNTGGKAGVYPVLGPRGARRQSLTYRGSLIASGAYSLAAVLPPPSRRASRAPQPVIDRTLRPHGDTTRTDS